MCAVSFFFWAVEDQRCGEALELGGHGHRNPPRCHADTRSDLDHDSGIPLQISTEIRTMYPNHVKRWGPHPERCPRLSRQAGQQGILTEPHICIHIHSELELVVSFFHRFDRPIPLSNSGVETRGSLLNEVENSAKVRTGWPSGQTLQTLQTWKCW